MTSSPLDVGSGSLTTYYDVTTEPRDYSQEHIASAVIGVFLLVFGAYLVGALSFYLYKEKRKNIKPKTGPDEEPIIKLKNQTNWLCLAGAIFALIRFVLDMVEIFQKEIPGEPCKWVRNIKGVFHSGVLTCLYSALWLRQRHFYSLFIIAGKIPKIVKFFSYAVIFFMVAANLCTITLYVALRTYATSSSGCRLNWSIGWHKLPGFFLFTFTTSFQVILLGLFVNLLYQRTSSSNSKTEDKKKTQKGPIEENENHTENEQKVENRRGTTFVTDNGPNTTDNVIENGLKTVNVTENGQKTKNQTASKKKHNIEFTQSGKYKPLIKRLVISMSVAMVSSGFVSLLAITVLDENYGALRQVIYGLDLSVTLLSLISSFKDWRSRLCSCLAERKAMQSVKQLQSILKC